MPEPRPRDIFLDGRVHIECPCLMTDAELAVILEAFVKEVAARPRKDSVIRVEPPTPSRLPFKMKSLKGRWR
jgi:hypothetical protein